MPELPEVESVRLGLAENITGRTIEAVEALHPRPVRKHDGGIAGFEADLAGRTFAIPRRRGKYLWLPFDDGDAMLAHLGMSGQFRVNHPEDEHLRNTRVLFTLSDGTQLRFVDQRMFGGLSLSSGGAELPPEIAHIAPDPLSTEYDQEAVVARIRRSRSGIKRLLLSQTVVSGYGNIYVDETLWRARVHYEKPGMELSVRRLGEVLDHGREVLAEALEAGGTSFDALYVNVNGESGYFERGLAAYGREGQPCLRCGRPIVREPFMNRSSYFCPACQKAPR
ncbi:bifunctional DNA-formamidopyrimidine glycosylase/DNA-(apurinic or apyrimidinic site) lyase [Aestuariimicrobium sp. p3-SID1156]|uniref:bifunctional DNA-formamidopyrimidine glycosylase/DNA-(apurinic or apyrimidinic site) lyase n=1 Tax=Aestuariimicrobium sp. p3-SID1156 TaxID=2916038 RepID=UPI00223C0F7E|nr:bifunctional DNA-formamidopyrimidine glycosylase/DNA-(apurinic or apyrimidinic site) lyase [Aestuariimicrobium sp. p3-SID1156]MCT1459649.1 bifunctional DNA-formamidopyrimidine glycosylase/DNA-(apurinic or apyrimidinic site) lyase [Aestuariimicrobium sp. p3-SID1156]